MSDIPAPVPAPGGAACWTYCKLDCRLCAKTCQDCGIFHQVHPYGPRMAWVCMGCTKVSRETQAEAKAPFLAALLAAMETETA